MRQKIIIGRTDIANFPGLELENIAVKIDTGAFTSSIHCSKIEEIEVEGVNAICFHLLDPSHPHHNNKEFIFNAFTQKNIKSSTGHSEMRYIIKTTITLFSKKYPIEISLTERGEMKYPVLLGRKFLKGKFIVDPAKYNLSAKLKLM